MVRCLLLCFALLSSAACGKGVSGHQTAAALEVEAGGIMRKQDQPVSTCAGEEIPSCEQVLNSTGVNLIQACSSRFGNCNNGTSPWASHPAPGSFSQNWICVQCAVNSNGFCTGREGQGTCYKPPASQPWVR
mmetsp:Transcript_104393/g.185636  ORF Transcript_104393/g.185636 Transcript_104393/m.185636 type:complete len:132 (+) Transcript_104393:91-486(+)